MCDPLIPLTLIFLAVLAGCTPAPVVHQFDGETMGTTYTVHYVAESRASTPLPSRRDVEQLLGAINQSMSTYIETSMISRLNASSDTSEWHPVDVHFQTVFQRAREVYVDTGGAFNPAVGPLVKAWGFGPEGPGALPDDAAIRELLKVVSFDAFELRASPLAVRKHIAAAKLDFNAIVEGYAIDAIGDLIEKAGVEDYLIELGGEVRARGRRPEGGDWRVGIEKPSDDDGALASTKLERIILLKDAALATSGNYRNFRIEDGKRVAHIVNPRTGYPALSSLLSVSVWAKDTITADAYATSLTVMGLDEGLRFVEAHKPLEAYFIAKDEAGKLVEKWSSGFPVAQ